MPQARPASPAPSEASASPESNLGFRITLTRSPPAFPKEPKSHWQSGCLEWERGKPVRRKETNARNTYFQNRIREGPRETHKQTQERLPKS